MATSLMTATGAALGEPMQAEHEPVTDHASAAAYVRAIFEREMGVTLNNAKAGSKRDEAMRELTKETATLYAKRVLRELIQNAFDGARSGDKPRILILLNLNEGHDGVLYVANSGTGFEAGNVDAISNPAMSNKTPGNFIGHKGLGFRSVELLSDEVQIFSKLDAGSSTFDGFCFRFASAEDELAWLRARGEAGHAEIVVGKVHRYQLPVPIADVDPAIQAMAAGGYSTLVRVELRDATATARAIEEMRLLLDGKAPIVLFLDGLHMLTMKRVDKDGGIETKLLAREGKGARRMERGRNLLLEEVSVDRHRFMVGRMDVDDADFRASVEEAVKKGYRVQRWRDWKGTPAVSVALPLSQDARAGCFYAFLPMETDAPFNGSLDAPFHPDADRRDLDLDNPLNSFLLDTIADLCLALAQSLADENASDAESASVAVDALAWHGDAQRMADACERAGLEIGNLRLPTVRIKDTPSRWAPLQAIFDWDDTRYRSINGAWLVRACGIPMLRRNLGEKRMEALYAVMEELDATLRPADENWAIWAPALVADLARRRRKTTKLEWENLYADLATLTRALPYLAGKPIFRLEDGRIGDANAPATIAERELFISPDPANATRSRKRLTGTTLFPPRSIAQRMSFADPTLSWPTVVTNAFFSAGLASPYNLDKVIASMGRLLGKRPSRHTVLAAINWAFSAWRTHKSNEVEVALRAASLPLPCADGKARAASSVRFGAGWRDTQGDLLAEFCQALSEDTRGARPLHDSLLVSWDQWPLREKGTASEWTHFLRLLGVKDGLTPVWYRAVTLTVGEWWTLKRPVRKPITLENAIGPTWRAALQTGPADFAYQSGSYSTDDTLWALPMQGEHEAMNDRAKAAYARLVVAALANIPEGRFTTRLRRTAGMTDVARWPSPLLAFLREAAWLPVYHADDLHWTRPREAWFAPRSDPHPRFLPHLDRGLRQIIETDQAVRDCFAKRLNLSFWHDPASAPARLSTLGRALLTGIADHEQDNFRIAYREAWTDWSKLDPRPALATDMPIAIQSSGRLVALERGQAGEEETLFVGGGVDPTLENLLTALGHRLLSVPAAAAEPAVAALRATGRHVRPVAEVDPHIIVDANPLILAADHPRLADNGREWLAEIAVLVLEFNLGPVGRSTPKSRQALFEQFRRLRVVTCRRVEVEIDGRTGPLPAMLDGVLPVADDKHPTVVVETSRDDLDWATVARMARGIALALKRAWLVTDFKAILATLANAQGMFGGLSQPDDESLARAFSQPVERLREVLRSLRASNREILDWLIPVAAVRFGHEAAMSLVAREDMLMEDDEIVATLVAAGAELDDTKALLDTCRGAEDLDELRRTLGISLVAFNAATAALGPPFPRLTFELRLRRAFADRLEELHPIWRQKIRDAFAAAPRDAALLARYRQAGTFDWATFDEAWIETLDELDDATIDARLAMLAAAAFPQGVAPIETGLDEIRQANRATLMAQVLEIQRIVTAWTSKVSGRTAPAVWTGKPELLVRDALTSGACDFELLSADDLPAALYLAGLWPNGMKLSLRLGELGLEPSDLDRQAKEAQKRKEEDERRSRTVRIGGTDIVGGTSEALQAVVAALQAGLASKAFQARSGPATLNPFPQGDERKRRGGGGGGGKDPVYLSDQQRGLIGFAGEYAAYFHLKRTVRHFADDHWISSMGRSYLCLPTMQDEHGYDFFVPRARGRGLCFEVKAHVGDPGYVDLERSQVAAAVHFANEQHGVWKILYVSHVLDPDRVTVHELANPFTEGNMSLYRPSSRQGVRLLIDLA